MENNIKKMRMEKGLTLREVAEVVGMTRQRIFQIENGAKTSLATRNKIIAFLEKAEVKGHFLKELRIKRGLKITDAARLIGIAYETLWRYETGRNAIGPENIAKICNFYGISRVELSRHL